VLVRIKYIHSSFIDIVMDDVVVSVVKILVFMNVLHQPVLVIYAVDKQLDNVFLIIDHIK